VIVVTEYLKKIIKESLKVKLKKKKKSGCGCSDLEEMVKEEIENLIKEGVFAKDIKKIVR